MPAPSTRLRIAIQGELGSFSHEAALALVPQAEIVPCTLSAEVFRRLALREGGAGEEQGIDAAVIPIENSLAGSVLEHYDLLLSQNVRIEQEYLLRIRHNLIGAPGATLAGLREVYSHPVALDQCRGFFRLHPHLRATSFYDTAGSVKYVLQGHAQGPAGAVASLQAAAQYGGVVLAEAIEDNPENYTRFLLIRRADPALPGSEIAAQAGKDRVDKVSLCFAVDNRPGSLVAALQVFASHRINLTRLESRPVPGSPWQYIFYADYQLDPTGQSGEPGQADVALAELVAHCSMIKELGRYRAAARP
jgi:prephenate dehydratase